MRSFRKSTAAFVASSTLLAAAHAGPAVTRIERTGLYGPPHLDPQGNAFNDAVILTPTGDAFGVARRFDGGEWTAWHHDGVSTRPILLPGAPASSSTVAVTPDAKATGTAGRLAWFYDGVSTTQIGLPMGSDAESRPRWINARGQVLGTTEHFDAPSQRISTHAWFFDGTATFEVGLTDPSHTSAAGITQASLVALNNAGQAVGYTARNGGDAPGGFTPWFFNGSTTVAIAPQGTDFTRADGRQSAFVSALTESGHATGSAERYNGTQPAGIAVWHHHDGTTEVVSPTSHEFTRADGTRNASFRHINEAGQILGTATRYNGQPFSGRDSLGTGTWLYDRGSLKNLGFSGGRYTRSDGYENSSAHLLNESGHVVGESATFHPSGISGQVTWLYNGATTTIISPAGENFLDANGRSFSQALLLNQANQAIGYALHFEAARPSALQRAGWFYDGRQTVTIALRDAIHRNADGSFFSDTRMLTAGGLVAGYSERYNHYFGGQTAWIWDSLASPGQELVTFDFGIPGNNGYNFSEILFLNDAGFAFGYYTIRNEALRENTQRAFGWFRDYGVFDFNTDIDPAWLAAQDISYFDYVRDLRLRDDGTISLLVAAQGDPYGRHVVRIDLALDAATAVPEPSTYGLATILALMAIVLLRKTVRKNSRARL